MPRWNYASSRLVDKAVEGSYIVMVAVYDTYTRIGIGRYDAERIIGRAIIGYQYLIVGECLCQYAVYALAYVAGGIVYRNAYADSWVVVSVLHSNGCQFGDKENK